MTDETRDDCALSASEQWDRTPWEPIRFEVGDRVAIHRSAECPERFDFLHAESLPEGTGGTVQARFEELFGDTGSIGHDVFVVFSTDAEGRCDSGWFAASELIPLAEAR